MKQFEESLEALRESLPGQPEFGLVLGSGLGPIAECIENPVIIPYREVPHMAVSTAPDHVGRFVAGRLSGRQVICMQGRLHGYEGHSPGAIVYPIRLMKLLGVEALILTNAAGGMNPGFVPGDLMLIEDHINMTGKSPLTGPNDEALGPRFNDMCSVYDVRLRRVAERAAAERLRGEVADERIARVRVESELAALREREQTSRRDREELERTMTAQFRSLAGEIFGEQSREFRRTNRESLDMLLKPFKDNITEFRERVERIYASENEQRGALKNELDNLMRLNVRMTAEATNLTNALRGNSKTQGDWGEVYLETILSSTGLVKGLHYDVQANLKDETGRNLRPDVLLRLPEERSIVIDSKVSLTAFIEYANAENEKTQNEASARHLKSMRAHIDELARKNYQDYIGEAKLDFVMMFIPNEPAYIAAMRLDPSLWQEAYDRKVLIVSPTHLVSGLRLIEQLWSRDKVTKNAIKIAEDAGKMYDKFADFTKDMDRISSAIANASKAHADAMTKLSTGTGNLVKRAQDLKALGIKAAKQLSASVEQG